MHVVSISLYTALCFLPFTLATHEDKNVVTAIVTSTKTICPISGTWPGDTRLAQHSQRRKSIQTSHIHRSVYTIISDAYTSTTTAIESSEPEQSRLSHATSPSSQVPPATSDTSMTSTYWTTATVFKILEKNDTRDISPGATSTAAYPSHAHNSTLAPPASHIFGNLNRTDIRSHGLFSGTSGQSQPTSPPNLPISTAKFVSNGVRLLYPCHFAFIMAFAFAFTR